MTAMRDDDRVDDDGITAFDDLYRDSRDPWGTKTRWYERRKRALLMASLPRERYGSVYEAGCGTGHVSVELSERATHLLASDASSAALEIAGATLRAKDNVVVERHQLPGDWPRRPFDLIVLGELVYFFDDARCRRIALHARASAGATGTVIACDWRAAINGYGHRGDEAHRRFESALGLPRLFEYADDDFLLTGWCADSASVAMRDGLR